MQLEAVFLGTGTSQGVPVIGCNCTVCKSNDIKDNRLRSSLLILVNNINILIDIGPDFRNQMLRSHLRSVNVILFTHQHRDHTAGLDDIRPIYYSLKKPIEIYAEEHVLASVKSDFRYLFFGVDYPGKPKFNLNTIINKRFFISSIEIIPIRVMHHKLPILGYRIGDLAYITDANFISKKEKEKLYNLEILIINSLQKEEHISHYNLQESLSLINDIQPKKAYLTHIGHGMGLHSLVEKELPENVYLAYDELKISF